MFMNTICLTSEHLIFHDMGDSYSKGIQLRERESSTPIPDHISSLITPTLPELTPRKKKPF